MKVTNGQKNGSVEESIKVEGKLFASISSIIVVIMVLLNELIGLRFTLE